MVRVSVMCTSYNRAVLERNPHVSEIFTYTKRSHHGSLRMLVAGSLQKTLLIWRLRNERFDVAIAASTPSSARINSLVGMITPRLFLRSTDTAYKPGNIPAAFFKGKHEVERVWEFGKTLGLSGEPPPVRVYPASQRSARLREVLLGNFLPTRPSRLVAVHLSSRKASQKWPILHFAELIRQLHRYDPSLAFVVFWAPGGVKNRCHAGDDDKAAALAEILNGSMPAVFHPTPNLQEKIDALAACDYFIGSDGGAMHLAAACGLPVVALFGYSSVDRWHPWTPRREVLQAKTKVVSDIEPRQVADAFIRLADASAPVRSMMASHGPCRM